jgi:hypothetical protein
VGKKGWTLAEALRFVSIVAVGFVLLCGTFVQQTRARPTANPGWRARCAANTASLHQLAQIFNPRNDGFQCLGITTERGNITAIRFEKHRSPRKVAAGFQPVSIRKFPMTAIESRAGAVLDGTPGHKAIIVYGHMMRSSSKVVLFVRYLYNGLTDEYHQCSLMIDHGSDSKWHLFNVAHEKIARIVIHTWSVPLIGIVGIANLKGACPTN